MNTIATALRRLTRGEYENTKCVTLFALRACLQGDSRRTDERTASTKQRALDISHVNRREVSRDRDRVPRPAIATQPKPPTVQKARIGSVPLNGL